MLKKDLNISYFKSKQVLVFCKNRNKKHTKTPLDKKTHRNRKSHYRMMKKELFGFGVHSIFTDF